MTGKGLESGDVSVEVKSEIEHGLEAKAVNGVEVGSEGDGKEDVHNNGVVTNGEDESDNSYVFVNGSDVRLEDVAKRGSGSEVLVELSDPEVLEESGSKAIEAESLDVGPKAENEEDVKSSCVVENVVSLSSKDAVESPVRKSIQDETKTDMVEEIEVIDEEADQGKVENTLRVEEPIDVQYSNELEDVPEDVPEAVEEFSDREVLEESGSKVNEVESLDGGPKAENEEDGKSSFVVENVVSLSSKNPVKSPVGESKQDETKTDMVEEIEIVDEEGNLGEVSNTVKVEEPIEVEYSNELEDVQEAVEEFCDREVLAESGPKVNVAEGLDREPEAENGEDGKSSCVVENVVSLSSRDAVESPVGESIQDEKKNDMVEEIVVDEEADQGKVKNNVKVGEEPIEVDYSDKLEDEQEAVDVAPNDHESDSNQISSGLVENGVADLEVSNPSVEEEPDSEVETPESNESEHTAEELEKESNEESSLDIKENQESEDLVSGDPRVNSMKLEQDEPINVIHESLSDKKVIVDKEPQLNEEESKLKNTSEVSSDVNKKCESLVPVDELDFSREEQTNSAYILPLESTAEFAYEAMQTISEDVPLYSIDQEQKELAGDTINGLHSDLGIPSPGRNGQDWADDVEVVEPDTDTGDSGVPTYNEWPELSYYNTKKKINTESNNDAQGSQESENRVSEEMHLADQDRKEFHIVSPEDDNHGGHKEDIVDAALSEDSESASTDSGTSEDINHTGQSTTLAGDNDQTDDISSPSVVSTCSHSISDDVTSAANLDNELAISESESKDDETNLNGSVEVPKVETFSSSEEDSSLAAVESEVDRRPFFFLIKVPRFEDDDIREQIKFSQQEVVEKTTLRDSYKAPIQIRRDNCMQLNDDLEAAKLEEKVARDNLKAKRKEIDAAQAVIDKVNNANTVEDIDGSIHIMEHRMQHETVPLSEEKQLMREIKRLKHFREQLSSSIGTQEELQEALDQKDQIKDHLKSLKRDLNLIRSDVQRAETATKIAKKKRFDEFAELNKLQLEFRAADAVRQEAYMTLVRLRRELAQKNKFFRIYKDTEKVASDYALSADKKALHSLCVNQVEMVMELWNTNDEFRKDYVKCNARSTLRRLKTFDGRSLGLDEEPSSLPYVRNARIIHSEVVTNSKIHIPSIAEKVVEERAVVLLEKKEAKKALKPTISVSEVSAAPIQELTQEAREEVRKTKEEEKLAKKAEEIRKKDDEDKMMERLQLEEKAKAKEALERKKRMAEKAQARAKLRAKKEAEQREKEREKRQRKKEKRKDDNEKDFIAVQEAHEELGPEKPVTVSKRHYKASHYAKATKTSTMPLNLRNRSRRKMQMWMWTGVAALAAVAMVLLWFGYLSSLEWFGY